jgi:hypothetical protein
VIGGAGSGDGVAVGGAAVGDGKGVSEAGIGIGVDGTAFCVGEASALHAVSEMATIQAQMNNNLFI